MLLYLSSFGGVDLLLFWYIWEGPPASRWVGLAMKGFFLVYSLDSHVRVRVYVCVCML